MKKIRPSRPGVTLGRADPSLTPRAGLHLVAELDRVLGITATLDSHIGPVKSRRRGLTAAEMLLATAETMLGGGDFMCDLDAADTTSESTPSAHSCVRSLQSRPRRRSSESRSTSTAQSLQGSRRASRSLFAAALPRL